MTDLTKMKSAAPNQNFHHGFKICIRHPSHRQSPGVCSVCVNEKLSKLSTSRSSVRISSVSYSSSSSVSEVSSCSSSECASPAEVRARYAKRGSVSFVKRSEKREENDAVLSKSRSMAAAFVRRVRSGGAKERRGGGFWSKVLKRAKRKKMER
uniref:Uncharacterized protein n=1 Tax=Kalanchoe fedtschenkoi TaxID=63787 RepID=A0A7N0UKQ8_KALFE